MPEQTPYNGREVCNVLTGEMGLARSRLRDLATPGLHQAIRALRNRHDALLPLLVLLWSLDVADPAAEMVDDDLVAKMK